MKIPLFSFTAALVALLTLHPASAADTAGGVNKALMQEKLKEAQSVLGSVATGDFASMEKSAKHLVELSNFTNWYTRQSQSMTSF